MSIKINQLVIENVKRVKAVKIEPTANGLTVIGGKNNQGKTSVLDAIAWALGGDRFRPTAPPREGSVIPPALSVTLSDGLVVERKGKNGDLKVIDPGGKKGGQQLLNEFVEVLALDLPRFMQSTSKEKAQTLLQIIGVGEELFGLEQKEKELYSKRHTIGQIADQKKKHANEIAYYPDAPKDLVSASELIRQQQEILARNGENQRKRESLQALLVKKDSIEIEIAKLGELRARLVEDIELAQKSATDLQDESTAELEANIADVESINIKVRSNLDKDKADEDAQDYADDYEKLTAEIEQVRQEKIDLLKGVDLPLDGLSVEEGELLYQGKKWDCMSSSDQLKVSAAIIRKLNPRCGFVLLDKLEQMDVDTLREFGAWLEAEGLQAIATRVSTGDECSIIISDGYVVGADAEGPEKSKEWKAGEF